VIAIYNIYAICLLGNNSWSIKNQKEKKMMKIPVHSSPFQSVPVRSVLLALILLVMGTATLFADTADLLPANIFRFRIIPLFGFADGGFDKDGEYTKYDDGEGASKMYATGLSLEYGILDWLTFAGQWTPGWVAWSDADSDVGKDIAVNANGVSDLFTGVAVQIVGQKAPVKNDLFRVTLAPGVKIPFSGPDALDEYENWKKDKDITAANPDNHALGLGGRVNVDFIPNILDKHLVFNLYSEFIGYPVKSKVRDYSVVPILKALPTVGASLGQYYQLTSEGQQALGAAFFAKTGKDPTDPANAAALGTWAPGYIQDQAAATIADKDVTFGYDLTFEFEASINNIALDKDKKLLFTAGLPFNYKYSPGNEIDTLVEAEDNFAFYINPYASLFLTGLPLPVQLELGYHIPVAGKNVDARHLVILQVKAFLKFW
jgi:hypothetical protein